MILKYFTLNPNYFKENKWRITSSFAILFGWFLVCYLLKSSSNMTEALRLTRLETYPEALATGVGVAVFFYFTMNSTHNMADEMTNVLLSGQHYKRKILKLLLLRPLVFVVTQTIIFNIIFVCFRWLFRLF